MSDRQNELAALRLSCYIGTRDFFKSGMKAAKKKKDAERLAIFEEIGRLRGFVKDPELKDCYWAE